MADLFDLYHEQQSKAPDAGITIPQFAPGQNSFTPQLAYRNNNPGNLRFAGQPGATQGEGGFAKFSDPGAGYQALHQLIGQHTRQGHTLEQYISTYAPPGENDTEKYISDAASQLGVNRSAPLAQIDPERLAAFQAKRESSSVPTRLNNPSAPTGGPGAETPPPASAGGVGSTGPDLFDAYHQEQQTQVSRAQQAAAFLGGAPRALGLPDTVQGWTEPPREDIQEVWDALKEGRLGHAGLALGQMLVGHTPGGAIVSGAAEHLPKAYEAVQSLIDHTARGEHGEAAKALADATAHTAAAMIPPLGGYVGGVEKIAAGDVAGGAGDLTFNTVRDLLGLKFSGGLEKPGEYLSKDWIKQQKLLGPDWPNPITKGLAEGFGVKDAGFDSSVQKGLPVLRAALPASERLDFAHLPEAIRIAEADNKFQAEAMENRAIGVGWKGDTTPIYKAKLAAIPEHLAEVDRPTYDALVKDAESYNGKQLSLKQLRALRATNNAMLDKYYGKTDFGQYNDMASHVRSSSLRAETEAARDIIAKGVDPEHGGEQYQELNDRLKSILDFKEAHENLYRDLRVTPAQQAKGGYNFSIFDLTSPEATAKAAGKALVQKYTRPDKSPYDSVARINKALDAYNNYTDEAAAKYKLPPKSIPRVAPTLSGYPPMKINLEPTPPPGSMRLNQQQLFPEGQEAGEGANDIGGILGRAETGQFPAEPIGSNRPLEQRMKQPEYKMFPWLKP